MWKSKAINFAVPLASISTELATCKDLFLTSQKAQSDSIRNSNRVISFRTTIDICFKNHTRNTQNYVH